MRGYHHQPELTASVIDEDGWFHTGDIAKIDEKGQVFITGRIKNMIVLSGGKKYFLKKWKLFLKQVKCSLNSVYLVLHVKAVQKDGTEDIAVVVVPKDELKRKIFR